MVENLISTKEVSAKLGVTRQTIRNWMREGRIKAYKLGGRYFFDKNDLDKLIKEVNISDFNLNK